MEVFAAVLKTVLDIFKLDFTLYGFTFSLWQVFIFTMAASILLWMLGRFFNA